MEDFNKNKKNQYAPIFDPTIWGPHYWFFLMTVAMSYPDTPNAVTKRKYYDFIMNLPIFIPNEDIGNSFGKLIDRYPVSPYLDNKESFVKWIHFIHNKVNVSIGKEEISYSQAFDAYLEEYLPKPIYLSEKIKISKYYIFIAFILICIFLIYIYW